MSNGPIVKLAVDLRKVGLHFPLDYSLPGGFEPYLKIDRHRFDEVLALLGSQDITDLAVVQEVCFIIRWMETEIRTVDEHHRPSGKFLEMWTELDSLKEYLLRTRITSVRFEGESERDIPSDSFIMKEEINIDRLCDGIRSAFKDEFHHDKRKRKTRGQRAWKRRKLDKMKNNLMNWMNSVPELEALDLEEQSDLIERMARLAGLPE